MSATTSSNLLSLEIDADDAFDIREFNLEDGMSSLFSVQIVAVSTNAAVDFESIVGRDAKFRVRTAEGSYGGRGSPCWSGIVSEIHQLRSEEAGVSTYHLTLSPKLWLLTQRTNCRVYQQMTDLDIVRAILGEWGIQPTVEVSRALKTRKYRVQYQETDFAFMSRLLEAAGITYFFRRGEEGSTLVLADTPEKGEVREAPLDHVDEVVTGNLHATAFRASRTIRSGKMTFADHDHRLPNTPLLAEAAGSQHPVESKLESFSYLPGAFRFGNKGPKDTPHADDRGRTRTDADEGKRIAEQAAFAAAARARSFSFESNALDLGVGIVLKVQGHPIAEREGNLLVTSVSLSGAAHTIPHLTVAGHAASTPHRPEMVTPRPSIHGVECATVVGPSGETIHCDEFGRVRVQFHWDRYGKMDEQSSCWVPVNQPWAGDALGSLNLPRIGQEVIVGFLSGDPEEPIIVGRLFTNLLRPPFPMPQNKTQSGFRSASVPQTGGYNEMMFEDKAGGELIRMRAERDFNTRVNRNHDMSIGQDRSAHVEQNDSEKVDGDQMHQIAGQMTSAIGKDQLMSVMGSLLSSAGGDRLLKTIGESISQALMHQITSTVGTTLTVGKSMIHIAPDQIIIQSPKVLLNPGAEAASEAALGSSAAAATAKA
ncbi:MAG: type VI secretion system tip protein TssI/VgrG [Minicystis sp.]